MDPMHYRRFVTALAMLLLLVPPSRLGHHLATYHALWHDGFAQRPQATHQHLAHHHDRDHGSQLAHDDHDQADARSHHAHQHRAPEQDPTPGHPPHSASDHEGPLLCHTKTSVAATLVITLAPLAQTSRAFPNECIWIPSADIYPRKPPARAAIKGRAPPFSSVV